VGHAICHDPCNGTAASSPGSRCVAGLFFAT
jgi:hypothetical protein